MHFELRVGLYQQTTMNSQETERFVRLPTELLEALLLVPLSGTQWRILFWVIRHTYGWNREQIPFSWYRIGKALTLDRSGVTRAGGKLLREKLLSRQGNQLRVERDITHWLNSQLAPQKEEARRAMMTDVHADKCHRKAMTGIIGSDDKDQLKRGPGSTLFRRAKDSSKDKSKIYKDRTSQNHADNRHRLTSSGDTERQLLAGTATPVPGKYDSISEN